MKLKTIIVDDEFPAIQLLKAYCSRIEEIELTITFSKASAALEHLKTEEVTLLLLDIQMPEMSGIEIMKQLSKKPMCIFITANPGFAVKAYELDVIDYLVKPVSFERFKKSIDKAVEYYTYKINALNARHDPKFLMVKTDYKVAKINTDDIKWIEGSGEYLKIVTGVKTILVLDSLNNYVENVLPAGFIRIHKSFIIPLKNISQFTSTSIILNDKKEFTVGRKYKEAVMKQLKTTG